MGAWRWIRGLFLLAVVGGACSDEQPCDTNQALRGGYCFPVDAAVVTTAADAAMPTETPATFGRPCAGPTDCVEPAPYCAQQPGQSVGFCSAFGCDADPTVCPAGWKCMDLTPFGLAAHMCIPGT